MKSPLPIIFSAAMVRRLRANPPKTETRRLVSTHLAAVLDAGHGDDWEIDIRRRGEVILDGGRLAVSCRVPCLPGDVLWVREPICAAEPNQCGPVVYMADGVEHLEATWKWKPRSLAARYMPRDLCRMWLRVGSVSIARLGQVDEAAAIREGAYLRPPQAPEGGCYTDGVAYWTLDGEHHGATPRDAFVAGWKALHGDQWNPRAWVWVIGGLEQVQPEMAPLGSLSVVGEVVDDGTARSDQ